VPAWNIRDQESLPSLAAGRHSALFGNVSQGTVAPFVAVNPCEEWLGDTGYQPPMTDNHVPALSG